MADITAIRNAIGTKLETISGLRVFDRWEGNVPTPAAIVLPDSRSFIRFNSTMGGQTHDATFIIQLLVSKATDRIGQEDLDSYFADEGAKSIYGNVSGTLPGTDSHFCEVMEVRNYGVVRIGSPPETVYEYLGAEFVVQVGLY
jgi:hypothetical protein